jgi:outer membrane protein OmpA-like peptidoglycan-associated protein
MAFNLVDTVKGLFTNDLVSKLAASLGETEGGIQKAISGAVPAVLTGLLNKAGSQGGASGILDMAKQAAGSGILSNLGGLFGGGGGGGSMSGILNMAGSLFGDKLGGITSLLSGFSGIKPASASSVVSMAAPAALAALGNHASQNNLSASGLTSFLHSQKEAILSSVPSGLNLAGALGLGSLGEIGSKLSHLVSGAGDSVKKAAGAATHYAEEAAGKASGGMKLLLPLLLGILVVALAIYLFRGCGGMKNQSAATADTTAVKEDTGTMAPPVVAGPVSIKVKLPNGAELDAYKGGIEDQLVAFLGTDYAKLGEDSLKKIWFNFDNLNFKTGSAEITPESQKQIDNIAAILKAFPKAKIKIGGYTDKTGDEQVNKKLSGDRAKAVKAALDKAGVSTQVTGAEGYGSAFAKYPAGAPESDRVTDRHVSVSVRP